jgi:uncharacterized protein (TIGR02594 family)
MSELRLGSRGNDVRRLQLLLCLEPDGHFGSDTDKAVRALQEKSELEVNGVVGPETWQALKQLPRTPPIGHANGEGEAPWMSIAKAELGVHEYAAPGKHNDRIIEYHAASENLRGKEVASKDETPWCSSFVNWVLEQAGYEGTQHALASSWLNWTDGTKLTKAKFGAITVITKKGGHGHDKATGSSTGNHVAFLVSAGASSLRLLGGNQGDAVKYSNFSLKYYDLRGYFWPKG